MDLVPYAWMPDDVLQAALPVVVRWAAMDPLISEVWAFGSRAGSRRNGSPRPDSDIDIGFQVVSRDEHGRRFQKGEISGHGIGIASRARVSLSSELGRVVDVQHMHPREAPHAYAFGRLGRRVYMRFRRTRAADAVAR